MIASRAIHASDGRGGVARRAITGALRSRPGTDNVIRVGEGPGWPVLRPLGRMWKWLARAAVGLTVTGAALKVVGVVISPPDLRGWQWALAAVAALVTLPMALRTWALAGRPHRLVHDPARPVATAADYRAARGALRAGDILTSSQRRLVAVEVAQLGQGSALITWLTTLAGSQVLNWSLSTSLTTTTWLGLALTGLPFVVVGVLAIVGRRGRWLREAAGRIGALPLRSGAVL